MEVKNQQDGHRGIFSLEENGQRLGAMYYSFSGKTSFVIEHTEIFEGNEGKGLGRLLVKAAVDFARQNGYKIQPVCPYAKSVFDKTEEYKDVLF